MATLSVRKIAKDWFDLTGGISVNTHLYGYPYRDARARLFGALASHDKLPGTGEARTRSLKRHLQTVSGKCTDLVIILVAHESDFSGLVTREQLGQIQYAIQVARDIYAQVDFGIRKIRWTRIPVADAGSYAWISGRDEAADLTDDWSGAGGGIDVFMVQTFAGASGWSNTMGPCSKKSKWGLSGAVIELQLQGHRSLGIILAHEVGHYLGLSHGNSITNVMGVDSDGNGVGQTDLTSTQLTSSQGNAMKRHCSVTPLW
jgi:hypothetical protein